MYEYAIILVIAMWVVNLIFLWRVYKIGETRLGEIYYKYA